MFWIFFYLCSTVIDQLHRPAALILDPNKNPSICITGGQFLEGLIPPHQDHLKDTQKKKWKGRKGRKTMIRDCPVLLTAIVCDPDSVF